MAEPSTPHPFSSDFRSKLSDVLSKPGVANQPKETDEKHYLETEIDAYSGVEFGNQISTHKRPLTPPKPVIRTFTFDKSNPFSKSTEPNTFSLPKYAEVHKPKNRPKLAPKPVLNTDAKGLTTNTLRQAPKPPNNIDNFKDENFSRVNSLPNLTPQINQNNFRASGSFMLMAPVNPALSGYGQLNKMKQHEGSSTSIYHMANSEDYCDVITENPDTVNDYRYDNVYEDVNLTSKAPAFQPEIRKDSDSDYTLMSSPVSDIDFTFGSKSLYENVPMINSPNSDVFHTNGYENLGALNRPLGDPNKVGLPEHRQRSIAVYGQSISPTSSFDGHDSPAHSVQSSMASTTASSFQRMQVCFFPPSPPQDFYQDGAGVGRAESVTSGSSTKSRSSRSRIPVPIKPKSPVKVSTPAEPDQELPPTPTPSPVVRSKNKSKKTKQPELSPPSPPANELVPINHKMMGSGGKGAKWYEKLGCIQTDTLRPSEAYGRPGEHKRSKSLSRIQVRKSNFFLPIEPGDSDPPSNAHNS